jgi:hypothetical protein
VALTREEILAKRSVRQRVPVEVPGWGTLHVAKFTARDRDRFEEIVTGGIPGKVNLRNVRAQVVTLLAVKEDGTRLFEDGDADAIGELDSDAVQAIVDAGFKINGLNTDALEDAVKN